MRECDPAFFEVQSTFARQSKNKLQKAKNRAAVALFIAHKACVECAYFVPGAHFNYSASWLLAATLAASGTAIFHYTSHLHLRAATKMTNGVFISNRFLNYKNFLMFPQVRFLKHATN